MYALMPWIAVIVTALAGWALIKRYSTHMVLLFAGLAILLCAVVLGDPNFLPKGVKPSGFVLFDIFNTLKSIATKQSAGIGFLIMTAGGFAAYMDRIGAAKALVDIAVKPLSMLRAPYLVLVGGYFVGQILVMVIPSAAGLAMLLLVALFPILKAVGTSAAAAAAVIGTSAGVTFAPTAGTANLAAQVGSLDPVIYLVQYQLPVAVPTLIVIAAAHYFVQRFYDKKNDDVYTDVSAAKAADQPAAPKWYAVFPILPIALLIIFSKLVVASIKLDTVSALFMVWIGVVIIEIIRSRDVKKVFKRRSRDVPVDGQDVRRHRRTDYLCGILRHRPQSLRPHRHPHQFCAGRRRGHGCDDSDSDSHRLDRDLPHGFRCGRLLVLCHARA